MIEFEPSSSPGINSLLTAARACFINPAKIDEVFLRQQVAHIQSFRQTLEEQFASMKQRRPRTELYEQIEPQLDESFASFRSGMQRIEIFLASLATAELAAGCLQTRLAVDEIMRLSQELAQEEQALTPACDSPVIRELVITLDAVARGQMKSQALIQMLDAYSGQIAGFLQELAERRKVGFGNPDLEELAPEIETAASDLEQLLGELLQSCKNPSPAPGDIEMARQPLIDMGQALWDLNQGWQTALTRPVKCPRCGASNPIKTKFCESCQALLIEVNPGQPTSTIDIRNEGENEVRRLVNVVRVEEAAEAYCRGDASAAEFKETLSWFEGRIDGGRQALGSRPTDQSTSEARLAGRVHQLLDEASKQFREAIKLLRAFSSLPTRDSLDIALVHLWEGESMMLEAEKIAPLQG